MYDDYVKIPMSNLNGTLPQPQCQNEPPTPGDPRMTHVKSEATKRYLKDSWEGMFMRHTERKERTGAFKENLKQSKISSTNKKQLQKQFENNETSLTRLNRVKVSLKDFEKMKLIGRGGSGEVWLVKNLSDAKLYAMKVVDKMNIIVNEQADSVRSERNLLAQIDNPWIVRLLYTFQDPQNLYFILEFVQGGDLFSLMGREITLPERTARFYIAEIALAIDHVHRVGFIHRDIKPDNILVTTRGHLKLSDFGLSTQFQKSDEEWSKLLASLKEVLLGSGDLDTDTEARGKKPRSNIMAGTIDYVAPEVLLEQDVDASCDWWSLGIISYELLYGIVPFAASSSTEAALKIIRWNQKLNFPMVPRLSDCTIDFMKCLLCDAKDRMTFDRIKSHPFFNGFDWDNLLSSDGPIVPDFSSSDDLSYFDPVVERQEQMPKGDTDKLKYAFLGFTYKPSASKLKHVDASSFDNK